MSYLFNFTLVIKDYVVIKNEVVGDSMGNMSLKIIKKVILYEIFKSFIRTILMLNKLTEFSYKLLSLHSIVILRVNTIESIY